MIDRFSEETLDISILSGIPGRLTIFAEITRVFIGCYTLIYWFVKKTLNGPFERLTLERSVPNGPLRDSLISPIVYI